MSRVQIAQNVPEFYTDMKLVGPGLQMPRKSQKLRLHGSKSPKRKESDMKDLA